VKQLDAPVLVMDTMIHKEEQGSDFNEDSVSEQATNFHHAYLVAHAKVYAIAEQ
jgi:hypothetical protein